MWLWVGRCRRLQGSLGAAELAVRALVVVGLDELVEKWPPSIEDAERIIAEFKKELRADGFDLGVSLRGMRAVFTGRTEGPEFALLMACIDQSRWVAAGYYAH